MSQYSRKQLSLHEAIARILFYYDLELPKEELQELYIAEDYFSWHDQADNAEDYFGWHDQAE